MPSKRGQLSMRPKASILERLRRHAALVGEKHTTMAERYLEEGLLMDEHAGIHFVDGALGRRPALIGTGLDVWEVVEVIKDNEGSLEEAAGYLEIDRTSVEAGARYYGANREEVDDMIARVHEWNEREEAKWRAAREAVSA